MNARPPMAAVWPLLLAALAVLAAGCGKADRAAHESSPAGGPVVAAATAPGATSATSALTPSEATDSARRVIRTAELSLDVDAPAFATARLGSLADRMGGFVVSSETSRSRASDGSESVGATVVFRVPAARFDESLAAVRAMGTGVSNEKITGQDVTEEYVDLEARLRAQRALEDQYVSVLREAKTIPDVLAVQQKLGEVRTEIERAEGRRRYLENQTSLSTLTVHVAKQFTPAEASGPGFGRSVREAGRDAVDVGVAIVNGAIRVVGVMVPVLVLLGLPLWIAVRTWRKRRRTAIGT